MKQIFDWLREHLEETANDVSPNTDKLVVLARVERLINEAEAKWEADCCEWEALGDYHKTWKFCPYCGKPIKIVEVE